jgi:hypothetical protein
VPVKALTVSYAEVDDVLPSVLVRDLRKESGRG